MGNFFDYVSLGKIVTIREALMKSASEGKKVFRLESGDPSFDIHPKIETALKESIDKKFTHYVPVDGIPVLRSAVSEHIAMKGIKAKPSDVFITNGAMQGLYAVYQALHEDDDKGRIVVPDPMWTEAVENIRIAGMEPVPVAFDPFKENYTIELIEDRAPSFEGVFINSPHNPTGKILTTAEKKRIVEYCVENDKWIISDEAYENVTYDNEHTLVASLIPAEYDKWISVHSMSKSYAMSGLRIGYIITKNEKIKSRLSKILRCTTNGINSITQSAAAIALTLTRDDNYFQDMRNDYATRRDIIFEALSGSDVLVPFRPEGGFFLWCKVAKGSADEISEKLAEMGIGNAPGSCFGESPETMNSIRFSFSVNTEVVREGSLALINTLNDPEFRKSVGIK